MQPVSKIRLKIYLRRECYVWLYKRGAGSVNFGWILGIQDGSRVVFKDDEQPGTIVIAAEEIEGCGAV